MLIQISDCGIENSALYSTPWFPEPKYKGFKETHQFQFLDIEGDGELVEKYGITDAQATELVRLLQHALEQKMNVVVHCFAGICRSGAVVKVAVMMGFTDPEKSRIPNTRVKTKMMRVLGWSYENS